MSGLAPGAGLALVIVLLASASGCSAHLLARALPRDPQLFLPVGIPGVLLGELAPSLRLRGGQGGASSSSGGEEHEDEDYSYDSSDQTPGVPEALQTSSAGAEQSSSISASPTSSSARAAILGTGSAGAGRRRSTREASAMKIDSMPPPPPRSPEDDGSVALRAGDSEEQDGDGWGSSSSSSILQTRRAADSDSENQDEEDNGDALSLLGDKDKSARGRVLTSSRHTRKGGEVTPLKVSRDETRGERDGGARKKRDKKRARDAEQPSAPVPEYPWEKGWVGPDGSRGLGLRGRLGENGEESSDDEQDGAAGSRAAAPAAEPAVLHVEDGEGETFSVVAKRGDVEVSEVEHWCDPDASSEQQRQWERDNFEVFEFVDDVGCGGRVGADGALHDGSTVFLERVAEQVLNKTGRAVRCAVFGAVCGAVCEACMLLGQTFLPCGSLPSLRLASFLFAWCEMLTEDCSRLV